MVCRNHNAENGGNAYILLHDVTCLDQEEDGERWLCENDQTTTQTSGQ